MASEVVSGSPISGYNNSSSFSMLPNGYSTAHIILTSVLISVIMFIIIFGNLLVVIAVFTDKTLNTTQNWFIASLSVADFLLGLVIMPFSLANEMMAYWYFGRIWCDLWKAIDVLLCTASILSICLISLDRYWSITRAIEYSRLRTPKRAALMIAAVWSLSAVICVPPLIGWKNPLPITDYPLCLLSDDIGYVLYSTMGSFYIPCVIMVFVYFKIYRAARALARKNLTKKAKKLKQKIENKCNDSSSIRDVKSQVESLTDNSIQNDTVDDCSLDTKQKPIENTTCDPNDRVDNVISIGKEENTNEIHFVLNSKQKVIDKGQITVVNNANESNKKMLKPAKGTQNVFIKNLGTRLSRKKKRDKGRNGKNSKGWRTASLREHERHKRKIAKARERRATIVLGLVMAAFILCWFPFFTLYIITSFCDCIGHVVFTVVFWAGYCNSALNPIIYTIFNREFRHAFQRIVCRKSQRWN
ncbi:5-hydroxytryptamine receptor 1F-like [Dreissena polymorpha]|uniref:G-protein coupled receptors family 1 profile domain-containing protein n=1 Tax=Dreissena polymorpha TaxID=45954 RepID=A0A9D4F2K2_DREPO|nr:5-hydroxytryptamine receptor 1F-like [Dreissena polymorpha]KAH3790568.1 hypothetical protein DPMN_168772 [Dreissena polymorpha]